MATPRAYTTDEIRVQVLDYLHSLVEYWATLDGRKTCHERLDGLAFSILVMLDGGAAALPGFSVAAVPHADDKAFHIERGEPYYEPTTHHPQDLGGALHEQWHRNSP
jgi:hypothetical protein